MATMCSGGSDVFRSIALSYFGLFDLSMGSMKRVLFSLTLNTLCNRTFGLCRFFDCRSNCPLYAQQPLHFGLASILRWIAQTCCLLHPSHPLRSMPYSFALGLYESLNLVAACSFGTISSRPSSDGGAPWLYWIAYAEIHRG